MYGRGEHNLNSKFSCRQDTHRISVKFESKKKWSGTATLRSTRRSERMHTPFYCRANRIRYSGKWNRGDRNLKWRVGKALICIAISLTVHLVFKKRYIACKHIGTYAYSNGCGIYETLKLFRLWKEKLPKGFDAGTAHRYREALMACKIVVVFVSCSAFYFTKRLSAPHG